jgi:hypothetical protein
LEINRPREKGKSLELTLVGVCVKRKKLSRGSCFNLNFRRILLIYGIFIHERRNKLIGFFHSLVNETSTKSNKSLKCDILKNEQNFPRKASLKVAQA